MKNQLTTSLLLPLSFLYKTATDFRNHLYNIGQKKSVAFDIPTINVGNLRVGGTGKTPHVEYLIRKLKDDYKLATLSRGYGRGTTGVLIAHEGSTAQEIGDEPQQFWYKYGPEVNVCVGEERILAVPHLLDAHPQTQVILLDDAFQHRRIRPRLNILLSEYRRPFFRDHPFPAGRLREGRKGASRADVLIISKCPPELGPAEKDSITRQARAYVKADTPIFFTSLRYGTPYAAPYAAPFSGETSWNAEVPVVLFTAIAQADLLEEHLQKQYQLLEHRRFKDHHRYSETDIAGLVEDTQKLGKQVQLLSTEKDFVKLLTPPFPSMLQSIPFFVIGIEVFFPDATEEALFLKLVKDSIGTL